MIYVLLAKTNSKLQENIINFVKDNVKFNNVNYRIIYNPQYIFENTLQHISENDIILWHPEIAYYNLELVKNYKNSIVILENETVLIQKISNENYINENLAINNGFFIIYINPDKKDITNKEYKLVVQKEQYLMSIDKLLNLIKTDLTNLNDTIIDKKEIFKDTNSLNQINLS